MKAYLVENLKRLIFNGFLDAEHAHKAIFNEDRYVAREADRLVVVTGHLAIANSFINAARSIYLCNPELSELELDDLFNKFDTFTSEVMNNIRTDHSHQWSNIEFVAFEESYQNVAPLLGLT